MTILDRPKNHAEGLTFDELRKELSKLPEDRRVGSPNTLSNILKKLIQKGLIEKNIESRKYRVPEGMPRVLTDELGRRNLASIINESEEFMVFHDSKFEKGNMHGFMDRHTVGAGTNAITWEFPLIYDSLLGHLTRGILDYAGGKNLFDKTYFEKELNTEKISDNQLDKIWKEMNLNNRKMILTYEIDSENLLKFLKTKDGKKFLHKAFQEFLTRPKSFHKELDAILYIDRLIQNKRVRLAHPLHMKTKEPDSNIQDKR